MYIIFISHNTITLQTYYQPFFIPKVDNILYKYKKKGFIILFGILGSYKFPLIQHNFFSTGLIIL